MYDKPNGSTMKRNCKQFIPILGIRRRIVSLLMLGSLPLLLGATCGFETCDIFNCDSLFFVEGFLGPMVDMDDDHDDMDGMDDDHDDVDGMDDDHDDMDGMDDGHMDDGDADDAPGDDDDHMDDVHDEDTDTDDADADAEDHDEGEEG